MEQAKRSRFDEAISLAQSAVEESRTLPEDAAQKIPSQSLAYYALARAVYDKGRRISGDERSELLSAAAAESELALTWIERSERAEQSANKNAIALTYHARLLELQAVIAHKLNDRANALAGYQQALSRLDLVPPSLRDSSWHLTMSRVYADQGMTFTSLHEDKLAVEALMRV